MSNPDFTNSLVLTGGGTGGHFFPAVALAEGAKAHWPERKVVFVGAQRGIEARRLPAGSWPYLLMEVEGFVGRSPVKAARSAWHLWRAVSSLKRLWRNQRPWAVIGTGGYGAAPALLAARSMGIPFFIHESNAAPGALVRLVASKARRVWCGMEAVRGRLADANCLTVGTPVREAFLRNFRSVAENVPPYRLLVLGGSGGARAINEAVMHVAGPLLDTFPDWEILHQTGAAEWERLSDRTRHPRHTLVPFLERMDEAMESASLLVSRAGASTCAELLATGRGAILVPLPTSTNDHQFLNARALAQSGRAVIQPQEGNFPDRMETLCRALLSDREARLCLGGTPEPNQAVEACLEDLARLL